MNVFDYLTTARSFLMLFRFEIIFLVVVDNYDDKTVAAVVDHVE
jgi:hypothetical protein